MRWVPGKFSLRVKWLQSEDDLIFNSYGDPECLNVNERYKDEVSSEGLAFGWLQSKQVASAKLTLRNLKK
jgi:hypothetical protein